MLWTIAFLLVILWMLGLETGFTMGSFIHILIVAAAALLLVSLSQEVMINQKLRHVLRSRGPKPDRKQTEARAVNGPTDAITDYALRYQIDAVLKNPNRHADPTRR